MWWLGHTVNNMFSFVGNLTPNCLPKWLYHFVFPPAVNESSCYSTSSPAFGVISVLHFELSDKCVMVSHGYFNLYFTDDMQCGPSSYMLICHLYIFFGEVSIQVFCPFFNGVIHLLTYCWILSVICIFWVTVLYQYVFCKSFLLVCGLSSHSLCSVLLRSEVFKFNEVQLIHYFMDCAFGIISKKSKKIKIKSLYLKDLSLYLKRLPKIF